MICPLVKIDDEQLPPRRIVLLNALPHFLGGDDGMHEGECKVRISTDDSVWANRIERDRAVTRMKRWFGA